MASQSTNPPAPLGHIMITADDIRGDPEGFAALLNQIHLNYNQALNKLMGFGGVITLNNHVNLAGYRLMGVGAPVDPSDAITRQVADASYSAPVLRPQFEAGAPQQFRTYRQVNNVFQQENNSTFLNSQGSNNSQGDNSSFSFSDTTTSISFWWVAFNLFRWDGSEAPVPANGSSGSPAVTFSGLTANTKYYHAARYQVSTGGIQIFESTAIFSVQFQLQTLNADGFIPVFVNWLITTPSSGTGGGGGTPGGGSCFTGETRARLAGGNIVPFSCMPRVVAIENEFGVFEADVIEYRDRDEWVIPFDDGRVTPTHNIVVGGKWLTAEQVFRRDLERYKGSLYDLHVRTDNDEARHFLLQHGHKVHNYSPIKSQ